MLRFKEKKKSFLGDEEIFCAETKELECRQTVLDGRKSSERLHNMSLQTNILLFVSSKAPVVGCRMRANIMKYYKTQLNVLNIEKYAPHFQTTFRISQPRCILWICGFQKIQLYGSFSQSKERKQYNQTVWRGSAEQQMC